MLALKRTWPSASARAIPSWRRSAVSNATSRARYSYSSSSARRRSIRRESLLDKQKGVQGSQYTSVAFGKRCGEAGIRPSMGSVGDAYDNAMAESFFSTLEAELLSRRRFASQAEAKMACFSYIEGWYNPVRLHSGLEYRSPITYEADMQAAMTQT